MAKAVPHEGDLLLRALSGDGTVGVRAISAAGLASEAATRQGANALASAALGRALLGTVLLAAGGKDGENVELRLRGDGPLRSVLAKWIPGYGSAGGRMAIAEQKFWMECIGMVGGPVRVPCAEMTDDMKKQMRADLEATGLVAKAKAGMGRAARRTA